MSLKSSLWRYLGLLAVAALAVGVFAGPASAKKLSAKQRAAVRAQLRKEIKKNPRLINRKSFLKRAGRVDFTLPVTVALRGGSTNANPNSANLDLGASLGQRQVNLGGKLAAEIVFHDSYDGGALGNVDVNILSGPKSLTTTSIPLLWNTDVSNPATSWDSNLLGNPAGYPTAGCGNVHTTGPNVNSSGNMVFGFGALPAPGGPGLSGVPIYPDLATYAAHGTPAAFAPAAVSRTAPAAPAIPLKSDINDVAAGGKTGDDNIVGANPDPFPVAATHDPGADGTTGQPTTADTVLRTNALKLNVTPAGAKVDSGVQGGENITAGKSGGQANLFGNIPGKNVGIDVVVNLETKINSIERVVDQDAFEPLIAGGNWPAAVFSCGQIWTGSVQNYIPGVHLTGSLKIAPGITAGGQLRIAKATLQQEANRDTEFQVAACLAPYAAYAAEQNGSDTVTPTVSGTPGNPDGTIADSDLPVKPNEQRPAPSGVACNAAPTAFVASTALPPSSVQALAPAAGSNGYTTTNDGSKVSISAGLHVTNVSADILVGDV